MATSHEGERISVAFCKAGKDLKDLKGKKPLAQRGQMIYPRLCRELPGFPGLSVFPEGSPIGQDLRYPDSIPYPSSQDEGASNWI